MQLRKIHRIVGIIYAPFFLITAITGIILLWRKAGVYGKGTKGVLQGMHNWEIVSSYIGVILAIGLIWMSITGIIIFIKLCKKKS
ncbi:MAG: hypothetical protein ACUZ8O_09605 [Candidatus Anammoxibacter sp.]